MLHELNLKSVVGIVSIIVFIAAIAGIVMAQSNDSGLEGSEVAYRFKKDIGVPNNIAEQLGISSTSTQFTKRERIVEPANGPPQAYEEFVIDSGPDCDVTLTGVQLAVLRTEFANAHGWGQYVGEIFGPECLGGETSGTSTTPVLSSTSTPETLFFPVIDDGGCRGYLTAEINPSNFVKELEYHRLCP